MGPEVETRANVLADLSCLHQVVDDFCPGFTSCFGFQEGFAPSARGHCLPCLARVHSACSTRQNPSPCSSTASSKVWPRPPQLCTFSAPSLSSRTLLQSKASAHMSPPFVHPTPTLLSQSGPAPMNQPFLRRIHPARTL
ncbi:hypothetical protein BC628DRAFT_3173 [Trametes gibbosa]|nr:hypothetical protein BC628DRAFT_3173 [Trametes gibbosa]